MQAINETDNKDLLKEWQEEARKQTLETLPDFLDKLATGYQHDYGTICHALAAGAVGAASALNASPTGGITGYQGGAVMWQFIKQWNYSSNECGLRIIDYDNVLYPQYADKFTFQSLDPDNWKAIQKAAKKKLKEHEEAGVKYLADLAVWDAAISAYIQKYPDYNERPDYYNHIGMGAGAEWDAERVKEESGFEFAPTHPYEPHLHPNVAQHWQSIADGKVPFQMRIVKD